MCFSFEEQCSGVALDIVAVTLHYALPSNTSNSALSSHSHGLFAFALVYLTIMDIMLQNGQELSFQEKGRPLVTFCDEMKRLISNIFYIFDSSLAAAKLGTDEMKVFIVLFRRKEIGYCMLAHSS